VTAIVVSIFSIVCCGFGLSRGGSAWVAGAVLGIVFLAVQCFFFQRKTKSLRTRLDAVEKDLRAFGGKIRKMAPLSQAGFLVSKVAHDINGPVTAIKGLMQVMQDNETLDPLAREDCSVMMTEIERISSMIESVSSFSKPEEDPDGLISPVRLLETVCRMIQFHPRSKGLELEREFGVDENFRMPGSKWDLQQVYFELLRNSLDSVAGQKEKKIRVSVFREPDRCRIDISDSRGVSGDGAEGGSAAGWDVEFKIIQDIFLEHGGSLQREILPQGVRVSTWLPLGSPR
jgi:signal transduction histidine kinase